jgi:hypothetical protein
MWFRAAAVIGDVAGSEYDKRRRVGQPLAVWIAAAAARRVRGAGRVY